MVLAPLEEDTSINYISHNDGFYPDMEDCAKFYECVSGKPTPFSCSNGLVYNDQTKACDVMKNVPECNYVMREETIQSIDNGVESNFHSRGLDGENYDKFGNVQVINEGKSVVEAFNHRAMPIDKTFDFTQQELNLQRPNQKNDIEDRETQFTEEPEKPEEPNNEQEFRDYLVFKDVKKELETKREIAKEKERETAANNLQTYGMTNHNDGNIYVHFFPAMKDMTDLLKLNCPI